MEADILALKPYVSACMTCMKTNMVAAKNLAPLKLAVKGCQAVTAKGNQDGLDICVKARIAKIVTEPCKEICAVPKGTVKVAGMNRIDGYIVGFRTGRNVGREFL
jgi:hypothetical protein